MQPGNTGRFFQQMPPFLRLGVDQGTNATLTDNGRGVSACRQIREEKLHVARPGDFAINAIIRSGFAANAARDLQLRRIVVGCRGDPIFVIKAECDFSCITGRPRGCARKDHIIHGTATQVARRGFAHHPRQGFDKIGFATSVWPNDACQAILYQEFRGFYKGFEPGQS